MTTYLILFRGINVGGNNLIAMKALKQTLTQAGFVNVQTYIQSGNILLEARDNPGQAIHDLVLTDFAIDADLMVLTKEEFELSIANNPFVEFEGKTVHFYFCHHQVSINQELVDKLKKNNEQLLVAGKVLYLHAPEGIGRSKLVANIEKCLEQAGTGRNLNTVNKIHSMFGEA